MHRALNLATIARRLCNDQAIVASRLKCYTSPGWMCFSRRQICSTDSLLRKSEEELKEENSYDERLAKIRAEDAANSKLVHLKVNPKVKISEAVVSKHVHAFDRAASFGKTKENFHGVIENFLAKDKTRRGHMEFLKAAMHYMEEFGLVKDVETYNRMLDVFPRGRFENRTLFDAIWAKQHPQAILALDILTMMEDNWLLPTEETYDILYDIFGHASQPLQKCKRLVFWYHKLEEMFPNPYPKVLPESDSELSKLALARMTRDEQIITIYKVILKFSLTILGHTYVIKKEVQLLKVLNWTSKVCIGSLDGMLGHPIHHRITKKCLAIRTLFNTASEWPCISF